MIRSALSTSAAFVVLLSCASALADWKFSATAGIAMPIYPSTIQTAVETQIATSGNKRSPLAGRFGVHTTGSGTPYLWGIVASGTSDLYSSNDSSKRISQFTIAGNVTKFFGPSEKSGIFLGADLGLAMASASNSVGRSVTSSVGPSIGTQLGYAWDVFRSDHPLLLTAGSSVNFIEGETYRTLSVQAGILF